MHIVDTMPELELEIPTAPGSADLFVRSFDVNRIGSSDLQRHMRSVRIGEHATLIFERPGEYFMDTLYVCVCLSLIPGRAQLPLSTYAESPPTCN